MKKLIILVTALAMVKQELLRNFRWSSNDSALGKINNYFGLFQEIGTQLSFQPIP